MSKSCNKSHALLPQLDDVCDSPRLLGVDPIVRYFPPLRINGQTSHSEETKSAAPATQYFNKNLAKMNVEYEDSDDDVCFGPITIKELRKASVLMKSRREMSETESRKTFLEALEEQSAVPEDLSAPSAGEGSGETHENDTPESGIAVEEFSFEEAHFSGCNLSGLNLSFENDLPAAKTSLEPTPAKSTEDGLYTLAFISDLAKKLEVQDLEDEPAKSTAPAKPHYSPISPAETSLYVDADQEEKENEPLEQSMNQWHDAEHDVEQSAKKTRLSDVSLLSNETDIFDNSTDDKNDTAELLNDTIEEMEMILSMGVDYFEKKQLEEEKISKKEPEPVLEPVVLNHSKLFATPLPKADMSDILEEYAVPRSPTQLKPSAKKFFPTPAAIRTPQNAKICSKDKSCSAGSSKVDLARQVHKSTPFRIPQKTTEAPRSADFKVKPTQDNMPKLPSDFKPYKLHQQVPSSRLPMPVRAFKNITSPVGQYINGPVMAPKIATAKGTNSPRMTGKLFGSCGSLSKKLTPKKADIENASPLPYVNYDSSSSIKVVEHKEVKMKPLPNKIKKLLPSPGSVVLRHTGRVNIPETPDGRHEVSIMVSQDAFQNNF